MKEYDFLSLVESKEKKDSRLAVAIGVFDGVHKGHRRIFGTLAEIQRKNPGIESMVITFSSNPKPGKNGNLDTLRLRKEYVAGFSINSFCVIDFSEIFSRISASGFAHMLAAIGKVRYLVLGNDFRCGSPSNSTNGPGLGFLLRAEGLDTELIQVDHVLMEDGEKISSSSLRRMIKEGDFKSYLEYSGQGYRVDLMTIPYRSECGCLVYCTDRIQQLLPPPGAYDAELMLSEGKMLRCILHIDEFSLNVRIQAKDAFLNLEDNPGFGLVDSIIIYGEVYGNRRNEEGCHR